jgi:dTDP-4-amino-4,6-dideoxygalactose transaminase
LWSLAPETREQRLGAQWHSEGLPFSTVRTAWDALLTELALPRGSKVLCSAVNIPDMFQILSDHELVPVPVDLNPGTMAVEEADWERAVTGEIRLVLVAHLLGTRASLDGLLGLCVARGIPVVEDCAQAFDGLDYTGDSRALVSLFSFGPIKTHSALGGAMGIVRDSDLRDRMRNRVSAYPRQSRWAYMGKVLKYGAMKILTVPVLYALFVRCCSWVGSSHDSVINSAVLGLMGEGYYRVLRMRPSTPLLAMLQRRLSQAERRGIEARRFSGDELLSRLSGDVMVLGSSAEQRSWWQFCVVSQNPPALISRLRAHGYDATDGASRLAPVEAPEGQPQPVRIQKVMRNVVYVPAYRQIKEKSLVRLADLLG